MRTHLVSGGQRPGGVVDLAGQALARVVGAIEVEIQVQRLVFAQGIAVVGIGVVLPPDISELRTVQADAQLIVQGIAAAQIIDTTGFHPGIQRLEGAIVVGRRTVIARGEVPGIELQSFQLAAGQLETIGVGGEQARRAGAEHRVERCQVAVFEFGLRDPRLECTTRFGILILGASIGIDRQ
ncbi:hypothetical protein D3C87_1280560 [compost metagenome]